MANKVLLIYVGFDALFLVCASLHLFVPLYARASVQRSPVLATVASSLLLDHCPLTAILINSFIMFAAFLVSLPSLFLKTNRSCLHLHAVLVVISALLTLGIGLDIWYSTLQTRAYLAPIWNEQTSFVQSMLQFKFQCCGYNDPAVFITDAVCTSKAAAAQLGTCVTPFSAFANKFLDIVFTAFFGVVAVDAMLILSVLCLIKEKKEKARYKMIDEKRGNLRI